ncbi:MAG TPA: peptidoglycan DD-metalloendopeptidase family protein, partial [Stellaceae bacterium]|nr:peptidoglycan DD-metalloendopeptidase family protein [Stellaceae bacterium]
LALYAAAASAVLLLWHAAGDSSASAIVAPAPSTSRITSAAPAVPTLSPAQTAAPTGSAAVEVRVGRNDTLDAIFRRMALDIADLAAIRQMPGIRASLDYLKPGDAIELKHTGGRIEELTRKVSEIQTLKIVRQAAGFTAQLIADPVQTRIRTASATIDSSLFQAAEAAGISDGIALKLAAVFAWDIDFVLDIREGDRFTAVYEQIYQDGKYLRDGEVLAAEFVNSGKVYQAVRFAAEASGGAGYYTPSGLPMRKAFLRAPVEFTRVSSVFNPHRLHPILNRIRGHMGTDYAAPTGTPVHAAGDGRVSFAGPRGGYGNAIVLAHGSSVSTLYGHMSRFAKHLRVGTSINQGDVIGYVGMTGLATGPHLHYEYIVNGAHKNPQTVHLQGAEPLRAETLQRFRDQTAPLLADLSTGRPVANAAGGPLVTDLPAGEPLARSMFSVSSVLNDSSSTLGDGRSRFSSE